LKLAQITALQQREEAVRKKLLHTLQEYSEVSGSEATLPNSIKLSDLVHFAADLLGRIAREKEPKQRGAYPDVKQRRHRSRNEENDLDRALFGGEERGLERRDYNSNTNRSSSPMSPSISESVEFDEISSLRQAMPVRRSSSGINHRRHSSSDSPLDEHNKSISQKRAASPLLSSDYHRTSNMSSKSSNIHSIMKGASGNRQLTSRSEDPNLYTRDGIHRSRATTKQSPGKLKSTNPFQARLLKAQQAFAALKEAHTD